MKRNFRLAFKSLEKLGVPLRETGDGFNIDLERRTEELWADYWNASRLEIGNNEWIFGINPKIHNILRKYDLHAEWINPGELGVYE